MEMKRAALGRCEVKKGKQEEEGDRMNLEAADDRDGWVGGWVPYHHSSSSYSCPSSTPCTLHRKLHQSKRRKSMDEHVQHVHHCLEQAVTEGK